MLSRRVFSVFVNDSASCFPGGTAGLVCVGGEVAGFAALSEKLKGLRLSRGPSADGSFTMVAALAWLSGWLGEVAFVRDQGERSAGAARVHGR